VGHTRIALQDGPVLDRYVTVRDILTQTNVSADQPGLASSQCSSFFRSTQDSNDLGATFRKALYDGPDPANPWNGQPILDRAASLQTFDGSQTTESRWVAGVVSREDLISAAGNPRVLRALQNEPVCQAFLNPQARASTQSVPRPDGQPGFAVFLNTGNAHIKQSDLDTLVLRLTPGTVLHETLHSLTGLADDVEPSVKTLTGVGQPYDLQTFVGLVSANVSSIVITKQLMEKRCVAQ